ncbi:HK97 gp10 family phage protein [Lactobacillus sp. S2-2]|uniref:HK97 gp10 family phage protein n=1 Tax=Lactobacillus sp. S2-2 TaxID=2692917 RepID=UPI001F18F119|nr:HK97 gp10 family phage protein [Lactobacillus sp. S2-2]MCF6515559.1 HK97 gp10 family phage protein [Lactobacillus sp. S2-2]
MSKLGDLDDKQLKQFANKLNSETKANKLVHQVETKVNAISNYTIANTKKRTPVDTGTLRRGWTKSKVQWSGRSVGFTISNNVEYASFLEYGHRTRGGNGWVSGRFMLRDTLADLDKQFMNSSNWKPLLDNYLKELFI